MDLPVELPKFNRWSFAIRKRCEGKLLDHQKKSLEKLVEWFRDQDGRPALVSMPTGTGKTGVICCLPYFLGSIGLQEPSERELATGTPKYSFDKPVLVIAPGIDIADQLEGQILISTDGNKENFLLKREIIPNGHANIKTVIPNGEKITDPKRLTSPDALGAKDVIIANAQKFPARRDDSGRWWGEELPDNLFRLVIVDEAHHVPAPTWQRIINKFSGHAMVVFLTATPFRTDGKPVVEGEFAYHLPLSKAREEGIIRVTRWQEVGGHSSDQPDTELFKLVLEKVKEIQDQKNEEQPLPGDVPHMAIAITRTQELANEAVKLWNDKYGPGTAIAYHGEMNSELPQMMQKIRNNKVKLVVVVGMLMEGFDHPPISIAAVMTKISSPVKFVQFVGRAQRVVRSQHGDPENRDIPADIVSHRSYDQGGNYRKFESGKFVEPNED